AGLDEITRGALMTLRADGFGAEDRRWFASAVLPCLVPIVGFLPDGPRAERLGEAKAMAARESDRVVREALSSFVSAK
ncbi:MAG: hypothetical protein JNK04_13460, partial [Myxococcales bacterium]|nr:hypothetical protein [Myxococcales bacterium]